MMWGAILRPFCGSIYGYADGGLEPVIIVGCGINVFRPAETLQTDGRNTPAFISDFVDFSDPDREAILNHLLDLLLDGISVACEPLGIQ